MIKSSLALLFIFTSSAFAVTEPTLWIDENDHEVSTYYDKASDAYLSLDCKSQDCWAEKTLTKQEYKHLPLKASAKNGAHPGSELCKKIGGLVILLIQKDSQNQARYCQGRDKSLVDLNSLYEKLK